MNIKILAVLIACPVLFFAADKMLAINGNDNPTKEESSKSTEIKVNSKFNNEEIIAEMKLTIKDIEGREKAFSDANRVSIWSDEISDDREKFIRAKLIKKLETENICSIDLERSFSRCPSGYNAYVVMKDDKVTNEGWFTSSSGCDSEPIAMFRYDVAASTMEAKVSEKIGYVPFDEFCKIYRTAKKSS